MKKEKNKIEYGDAFPITPFQIKRIRQLCQFDEAFKNEVVFSHTGQTSLKQLNQKQAIAIIRSFEPKLPQEPFKTREQNTSQSKALAWGTFDKDNPKHRVILSTLRQMQWVKPSEKHGEVADIERFGNFLMSDRSPVQKPLKEMNPQETEKVIKCLEAIFRKQPIKP